MDKRKEADLISAEEKKNRLAARSGAIKPPGSPSITETGKISVGGAGGRATGDISVGGAGGQTNGDISEDGTVGRATGEISVGGADDQVIGEKGDGEADGRATGAKRNRSRAAAIIALFLLIYIPSTFNWFSGGSISTDILRDGALYEALHTEAIVVRNEELIYSPVDGFSIPAINEGERVPGNSLVATVYSSFTYELMDDFEQINRLLLKEQYETIGTSAVYLQEADNIEKDVTNSIKKMISEMNSNTLYDAALVTKTINGLLIKRAEAYGALESDDPYINMLKDEKHAIENEVAEGSRGVYSAAPGHLSFILDGYESELTPESIKTFSNDRFSEIAAATQNSGFSFPTNTHSGITVYSGAPFAKIVKDNNYYLAIKADDEYLSKFTAGDKIRLRIENPYLEIDNAVIEAIYMQPAGAAGDELDEEMDGPAGDAEVREIEGGDGADGGGADGTEAGGAEADGAGADNDGLMVIRLNQYLYDFLSVRTVNVAVVDKYLEGLKIPLKSLRDVDLANGSASIVLLKGSHASVRQVRILASNDIYAIIESYDATMPEGRVGRYDTYIRDAINIEDKMILPN